MGRLSTCIVLLLLAGFCVCSSQAAASTGQPELSNDDFIVAVGTMAERMVLAQSTRSYREGIRAYIAVEEADEAAFLNQAYGTDFREAYGHYPDEDIEARGKKEQHAANPGDVRAAMVPFLAHAHYGPTYKWLLYGDDGELVAGRPKS